MNIWKFLSLEEREVTRRDFLKEAPLKTIGIGAALGALLPGSVYAAKVRDGGPCGAPPPPKPAQRAGAESLPPLPLPVTPMRRTEKKRPPAPPVVISKVAWGSDMDWNTDLNDVNNLLQWMRTKLSITFGWEKKDLNSFSPDTSKVPMLYRTGHTAFEFSKAQQVKLREFIVGGGFMVFDSCCGKEAFRRSARTEIAKILPEKKLRPLPPDHPIYHSYYDVRNVSFTPAADIKSGSPALEGIDIGCRTVVVFSPYDMSCGWDFHTHKTCAGIQAEDACKLGANLVAYATATKTMGMSLSESRVFVDKEKSKGSRFAVGQIMHTGQWNPDPSGLSTLLDTISLTTTVPISFDRGNINLGSPDLFSYPFLYMTGHDNFQFTDVQAEMLRKYLAAGGFLFADSCCGRMMFDKAFRREIKRVLPELKLSPIPPKHPIYGSFHTIGKVQYTAAAQAKKRNLKAPQLEGITIEGNLAVVYSSHDIGCGWELKPCPYCVGYESKDALRIGTDVVMYALTH